ncbi:MAG TPA: hypothetical protein VK927_08460, partial [Adhaeribacter sp.]|nr:hypothetical protein [Adhaeribacter sp.]
QPYTPVSLTGFTADIVANGSGAATSSTTHPVDDGNGFSFVALNYVNPSNQSPTTGLPNNGTISSVVTSSPGLTFQLAPFTGNNALRIAGAGTGTLNFASPRSADQVYLLATTGSGTSTVTITVTFADNTTQTFNQTVADWFYATGFAIQGISRVGRTTNVIENSTTDPRLYQYLLTIAPANTLKPIQSITFNKTNTGTSVLNVMAVSIRPTAPALPNDIGISAISGISSGCGLSGQETITVTINNPGTSPQSNFPVSYKVNNLARVTENFTGTVAPNSTSNFTFAAKADLSATGTHTIIAKTHLTGDGNAANDSAMVAPTNSLLPALPVTLDFESATTGLGVFLTTVNANSAVIEGAGASNGSSSAKGLIMDGKNHSGWVIPVGVTNPWNNNPTNHAVARICIDPRGGNPTDPLWLSFDLKQLFKNVAANTNFRVVVNGTPIGGNVTNPANTYQPPFSGTPIAWQRINLDLSALKNQPSIEIAFESSVKEEFANGTGTANLIDNIRVLRSSPLSTASALSTSQVQVYPNPSAGIFTVTAPAG